MTDSQSRLDGIELKRRAAILEQYKAEGRRIDGARMDCLEPKPSPAYKRAEGEDAPAGSADQGDAGRDCHQQRMIEALAAACKIYGVAEKIQRARRCQ